MKEQKSKDNQIPTPESMATLAAAAKAGLPVKPPSLREFWKGLKAIANR